MRIFAIDPGPEQSGWVWYEDGKVINCGCEDNEFVRDHIKSLYWTYRVAIEMIQSYGMTVGKSTFQTCVEIGRFVEVAGNAELIPRPTVKNILCGTTRAKDKDVWRAVTDRFDPDPKKAVGTKKAPGPLYGIKSHTRMALAVALAYEQMKKEVRK